MNATIVVALEEFVSAHSRRAKVRDHAREVAEHDAETVAAAGVVINYFEVDDLVEIASIVLGEAPRVRDFGLLS